MEDNTLQGLLRMIESRESRLYKLEGMGHWHILNLLKPADIKVFEIIAGDINCDDFYEEECYRLDYEGLDPDLDIIFHGKIHGIIFGGETSDFSMASYFNFHQCSQSPCLGCGDNYFGRHLKLSTIEVTDLPIYMQNVTETFERILKNGEDCEPSAGTSPYPDPPWDTEPEVDPDTGD